MYKRQFLQKIQDRFGCTKVLANEMLDGITSIVKESILNGQVVSLPHLGKIELAQRKGKRGINPRTMTHLFVPPYTSPRFKPSSTFKADVKKKFNS